MQKKTPTPFLYSATCKLLLLLFAVLVLVATFFIARYNGTLSGEAGAREQIQQKEDITAGPAELDIALRRAPRPPASTHRAPPRRKRPAVNQ